MRRIAPWPLAALAFAIALAVEWRAVNTGTVVSPPKAAIESTTVPPLALHETRRELLPMPPDTPAAHASTLALLHAPGKAPQLLAYWFAGTRESAADVRIVGSRLEPGTQQWSPAFVAVDRHQLSRELGYAVRRLGNPVAWVDAAQRVHLFVVATGLGGWAASRVVHLVANGGSEPFVPQRVLPLSPFFNTSTLVRTMPLSLTDGGALLPAYFELGNRYPVALRLDRTGTPLQLIRISSRSTMLQPALVALDAHHLLAFMRDHSDAHRVQVAESADGGASWEDRAPLDLPNPNASIAALRLPDGSFVLALNPITVNRHQLALARSRDGRGWTIEQALESGNEDEEYSYPSLIVVGDELHLTYTWKRRAIAHRVYRMREGM